ncbi:MAG TPA: ureidoglycolate lyase [Usitatibacter sp.]|jgi:ureidoglycolate lyase|nr:ureidoglycolate lyase [Usitatibacter sp.]
MRRLAPRPLAADAFAPFGIVIDTVGREPEAINAGTTQRFPDLAALDLRGAQRDPVLGIYVAQARAFPLRIAKLERHRQAAQVFLPLGTQRFVVVVAPGGEAPRWQEIEAFVTAPGQGISLHRGCWHHGLVALGDGDRFAVIEGGNYRGDTQEAAAGEVIELAAP